MLINDKLFSTKRTVVLPGDCRKMQIMDMRTGLILGTVESLCSQHDIKLSRSKNETLLSGPAFRMQKIVEALHFCRIKYVIR